MEIGDEVLTRNGERGTIVKKWEHNDDSYDWWVEIPFNHKGKDYITKLPFKKSDLRNVDNSKWCM